MRAATRKERGYGQEHVKLRRRWDREVKLGGVRCARCHRPIDPDEPWDLGHDDEDRSWYVGPEHRYCNRSAAAKAKRRASREW